MILFCGVCHNLLLFKVHSEGNRFECYACGRIAGLGGRKLVMKTEYNTNKLCDIRIQGQAMENAQKTQQECPKCRHDRAYFTQMQTRSADEPMTIIYKCCNEQCGHTYRED